MVRGSNFFNQMYEWSPLISILLVAICTVILLFLYLSFFASKFTGKFGKFKALKSRMIIALIIVFGFTLQGFVFLSSKNVKHVSLKKEFNALHPIIRLSISTLIFFDGDLLITDASRAPEDYKKMGLPSIRHSLHYPQKDGFVYAVDLRTKGRPVWKNTLVKNYFWLMGFKTLRHVGTEDHLHVSLFCPYLPGSR